MALPGYQAFDAVNTANCDLVQQYNVGDTPVPNTGTQDFNYDSTDEGVAMYGNTLYFADTGNDTVAVIDSADAQPEQLRQPDRDPHPRGLRPHGPGRDPGRQPGVGGRHRPADRPAVAGRRSA